MRELDLILGPFADRALPALDAPAWDAFDALLSENDSDLLPWLTGLGICPRQHAEIVETIRVHHGIA
jgi:antitoxin CptB